MSLALQLSNEGRYAEADGLFADAGKLAPGSADATAQARLLHYRGLDAMNQGQLEPALTLLAQADTIYAAAVPADALDARPRPIQPTNTFTRAGQIRLTDLMPSQDLLTDPRAQAALLGLIEVRRNRAVVLRIMGRDEEANALLKSATDLARGNGLSRPIVNARLYRTSGLTAAAQGLDDQALADLLQSTSAFDRSLPGSKPLADTYLLRARQLVKAGKGDSALPICRNAVQSLAALKAGTTPVLMASCLDVYAAAAEHQKDQRRCWPRCSPRRSSRRAASPASRSPRPPRGCRRTRAIRRWPRRSAIVRMRPPSCPISIASATNWPRRSVRARRLHRRPPAVADLDKQISDAQSALADADAALQAASPNYGQLVQEVVPAKDVFAVLHPNEAFAAIALSDDDGWVFLLRNGTITVSKIDGGLKQIAELVRRVRAGIELTTTGLPTFDIADAQKLYQMTLGGVASALDGVKALVVAPAGPLLSLPFEVLLTGPADAARSRRCAMAGAQVHDCRMCRRHPTSSRCARSPPGSRATRPWFGFGDFHPVTLAQAEKTFSGAGCGESAKLLAGLPTAAVCAQGTGGRTCAAWRRCVRRAARPGVHRRGGAEGAR